MSTRRTPKGRRPSPAARPTSPRPVSARTASSSSALRLAAGDHRITVAIAAATWAAAWAGGNLLGALVIGATGEDLGGDSTPVWVVLVSALALWTPVLFALRWVSTNYGTGRPAEDFRFSFRPIDLVGIPIGVAAQLGLVRALYLPLAEWWPDTFGRDRVEESARRLADAADGLWIVVLALVVVVGAPVVEELLYRGLLQGAFERRVHAAVAVVVVAVWFMLIHFRPVEYPGLFVAGLVFGVCAWRTGRLGMAVLAHVGFNATGLALVL